MTFAHNACSSQLMTHAWWPSSNLPHIWALQLKQKCWEAAQQPRRHLLIVQAEASVIVLALEVFVRLSGAELVFKLNDSDTAAAWPLPVANEAICAGATCTAEDIASAHKHRIDAMQPCRHDVCTHSPCNLRTIAESVCMRQWQCPLGGPDTKQTMSLL